MLIRLVILSTLAVSVWSQDCRLSEDDYSRYMYFGSEDRAPSECRPYLSETDPVKMFDPQSSASLLCCATFYTVQFLRLNASQIAPMLLNSAQIYPRVCSSIALYETCVRRKSNCSSKWDDYFLQLNRLFFPVKTSRIVLCDENNAAQVHPRLKMLSQNPEAQLHCLSRDEIYTTLNFCFQHEYILFERRFQWTEKEHQLAYEFLKDSPGCPYQYLSRNTQCSEPAVRNIVVNIQLYIAFFLIEERNDFNLTGLQNIPPLYDPSKQPPEGNPGLVERCTAGVTGDPHHFYRCGTGEFLMETCSSQGQQSYLINNFIVITTRNEFLFHETNATTVRELIIQFFARFDSSASVTYNASNGAIPSSFTNGQSSYETDNEQIQIRHVSTQRAVITHTAAGLWLEVQVRSSNYFFTVRLSKDVWDLSSGILKGCGPRERLYLGGESGRRRRQAVGALCSGISNELLRRACEFDCSEMGEVPGCQDMSSASETSLAAAVSDDVELIAAANKANEELGTHLPSTSAVTSLTRSMLLALLVAFFV